MRARAVMVAVWRSSSTPSRGSSLCRASLRQRDTQARRPCRLSFRIIHKIDAIRVRGLFWDAVSNAPSFEPTDTVKALRASNRLKPFTPALEKAEGPAGQGGEWRERVFDVWRDLETV
ncbi:hypothetical protein AAFF_G00203710 [Aldrovandia affinis]|uniref:Uncharacterized protein n=1 Tax=Aldrovandia affinis TaxID=143900 RepID=A0AAD7SX72_9TELE|nr:hypothetical protein AAFF_G00203710 [Aldrovandia affinis]